MSAVDPVRLGRASLTVSRLGLGTAWFGNFLYPTRPETVADTLEAALDAGIRLVDTAPFYGLGLAEQRIGPVLRSRPRDSFVLCTKVGRMLRPRTPDDPDLLDQGRPVFVDAPPLHPYFDFSYDAALRSVEESLERLGLDRVDIALIHDPDDHYEQAVAGAYRALERLRAEGTVSAIGVGMNQAEMLVRFARETDIDCVLLACRYTLLDQSGLVELLPLCADKGIAVIIGGVYNTGYLANPLPGGIYNYRPATPEIYGRALRIREICERYSVPLKTAALRFPFGHPAVTTVLAGVRDRRELEENVAALQYPIPEQMWQELRAEGLLPEHAPIPS